jgi:ATP-binding cassette, subfamily C (CFTR/MRP), member 1
MIYIDDVDISGLSGELVRSKITTIPQEPYFPDSRTIRVSLDGMSKDGNRRHTNAELVDALDSIGLLSHVLQHLAKSKGEDIRSENGRGTDSADQFERNELRPDTVTEILDANMGSPPLSAGQLQLFCLAHALLQDDRRIVLLDEVTSALEQTTEQKLHTVLKEKLRGRTVLMIAHRPEMLRLCDVVVHIEGGIIASQERL